MPFKANAARWHRIPKQRYGVTNWAKYDASLRQRGSLTVWFTTEAIAAWRAGNCRKLISNSVQSMTPASSGGS
jgi:hypothetical protein